eukprot:gene35566-51052_t
MSEDYKAKGNAAFKEGDFPTAVRWFTLGIDADATNHVLYSNRSACYASMAHYQTALGDAARCTELKPDWAKGYARLGAAYHGLRQYDDAVAAYEQGLQVDPGMESLKSGLASAEAAKLKPPNAFAKMFRPEGFVEILNKLFRDPDLITTYIDDPRIKEMHQAMKARNDAKKVAKGENAETDAGDPPALSPEAREEEPEPLLRVSDARKLGCACPQHAAELLAIQHNERAAMMEQHHAERMGKLRDSL